MGDSEAKDWHVPTYQEYQTMINFLGGYTVAGGKLKAVSNLWLSPNFGATNSTGFTGLPGGYRDDYYGFFFGKGYEAALVDLFLSESRQSPIFNARLQV